MDQLMEATLTRLRDRLRERGQRSSVAPERTANLTPGAIELLQVTVEYGPLCEAMFLMMAADGRVLNVEREVLKGAMRVLTHDSVSGHHIEAMLDTAAKRLAAEGAEARLTRAIEKLREDPVKAEVAFVLAAAIALADGELHEKESEMLDRLKTDLAIDQERVAELMSELETDRESQP